MFRGILKLFSLRHPRNIFDPSVGLCPSRPIRKFNVFGTSPVLPFKLFQKQNMKYLQNWLKKWVIGWHFHVVRWSFGSVTISFLKDESQGLLVAGTPDGAWKCIMPRHLLLPATQIKIRFCRGKKWGLRSPTLCSSKQPNSRQATEWMGHVLKQFGPCSNLTWTTTSTWSHFYSIRKNQENHRIHCV